VYALAISLLKNLIGIIIAGGDLNSDEDEPISFVRKKVTQCCDLLLISLYETVQVV
jgi:hypothetical protein